MKNIKIILLISIF